MGTLTLGAQGKEYPGRYRGRRSSQAAPRYLTGPHLTSVSAADFCGSGSKPSDRKPRFESTAQHVLSRPRQNLLIPGVKGSCSTARLCQSLCVKSLSERRKKKRVKSLPQARNPENVHCRTQCTTSCAPGIKAQCSDRAQSSLVLQQRSFTPTPPTLVSPHNNLTVTFSRTPGSGGNGLFLLIF